MPPRKAARPGVTGTGGSNTRGQDTGTPRCACGEPSTGFISAAVLNGYAFLSSPLCDVHLKAREPHPEQLIASVLMAIAELVDESGIRGRGRRRARRV